MGDSSICRRVFSPIAASLITGSVLLGNPVPAAHAQANLLTNGNFETGTFAGWTRANVSDPTDTNSVRNFVLDTPGTTTPPANGYFFNTASNTLPGGGGSFYALSLNGLPGESALLQSFTTPTVGNGLGLRVTLTFDLFVNDQSGYSNTDTDGTSLDYTTGGTFNDNQYARVDLLTSSAANFSTSTNDVLFNVPLNVPINDDPVTNPNPYQRYTIDITPYVQANKTYKIRFAEVDNLSALNVGVDNVGIRADITPEPAAVSFFAFAPALFFVRMRRKPQRGK